MKKLFIETYVNTLADRVINGDEAKIRDLAKALRQAWKEQRQVFVCGNGGSAANALHIANDLFYGIAKDKGAGIRVHALCANQSVVTCLANDVSYADIFSRQIEVLGKAGDLLIALSGSGNSANIVKAIESARKVGMKSYALLGYSGGRCLDLADVAIHFPVDDMQISEDIQLVVGHMLMKWLRDNPPDR